MISNNAMTPKRKKAKPKKAKKRKSTKPKKAVKSKKAVKKRGKSVATKKLVRKGSVVPSSKSSKSLAPTAADPLLQAYMREVNKYPLLTREEEQELARLFRKTGDRQAFQQLVTSNLRFVVKIAYQYVNYRLKLLDLIQEGNMGLVKAVEEFDPYKEVRLTTYAVWWIRSYIQDSILKNYSLVKMGTTQAQKKLFYRLRKEQAKLEREGIAPPERVKLLASRLDVREKDVVEMEQRMGGKDVSLDAPTTTDEKQTHMQFLADDQESVDETLADSEQKVHFQRILKEFSQTLEGRDQVFFNERLIAEKPKTLQQLGEQYGVSKERARQIEEKIKNRLKAFVVENYPDYNLQ